MALEPIVQGVGSKVAGRLDARDGRIRECAQLTPWQLIDISNDCIVASRRMLSDALGRRAVRTQAQ